MTNEEAKEKIEGAIEEVREAALDVMIFEDAICIRGPEGEEEIRG